MSCPHAWQPNPSDARSAMLLVGEARCLRCHKVATAEDMAALGRVRMSEPVPVLESGVLHDYDVLGGR